jgi:prepilin-type N-terminal cleavage/methylation domain-containing protein
MVASPNTFCGSHSAKGAHRNGVTIIEILVVVAITSLLVAIIIPAVMSARGSANRLECENRMRQWGMALIGFEETHGSLPFGVQCDAQGNNISRLQWVSAQVQCLPYLEQAAAHEDIISGEHGMATGTALKHQLPIFHCPLEQMRNGLNYRTCTGRGFRYNEPNPELPAALREHGIFPGGKNCKGALFADITDGLSNTAAMSERSMGKGDSATYDRSHDVWYSGAMSLGFSTSRSTADDAVAICAALEGDPSPSFSPYSGHDYLTDGFLHTSYNHTLAPNSTTPDCSLASYEGSSGSGNSRLAVVGARSDHPGGTVSMLLMDGSVKAVSSSIDLEVWRSLASRSAGDEAPHGL